MAPHHHAQPVRRPAAHCAALPPQPLIDLAFYVETMQEDMSGDLYVARGGVGLALCLLSLLRVCSHATPHSTLTISFIISCIMTYWFIRLLFMGAYGFHVLSHNKTHAPPMYHDTGFGVVWAFVFQPPKNDPTRWRQ